MQHCWAVHGSLNLQGWTVPPQLGCKIQHYKIQLKEVTKNSEFGDSNIYIN